MRDWKYLAGIFDGEGCKSLSDHDKLLRHRLYEVAKEVA